MLGVSLRARWDTTPVYIRILIFWHTSQTVVVVRLEHSHSFIDALWSGGSLRRGKQLKGHCIEFKYYADGIHSGLTPPG